MFGAPKGKLVGPVKTQFGYLVFQVNKITPAKQQTLAQATPQIRQQLSTGGQRKALQSFVKDFEKKWKGSTDCRKGYVVQVCKNAPKPKATSTAPPVRCRSPAAAPQLGRDGAGADAHPDHAQVGARARERAGAHRGGRRAARRAHAPCCAASAPGTASRTSARSSPTPSRRPTSSPTPPGAATTPSCWTSSATCSSRSTSSRCCSEERGAGDLAAVADHCHAKLVRRHPHVFGEVEVRGRRREVLRNWDRIKAGEEGREPGIFGDVPENLPGPLYARKVQRRAASSGFDWPDVEGPLDSVREEARARSRAGGHGPRPPRGRGRALRTRSATCSSPPSRSRASCASTPSSPCAPPPTAFATRVQRAEALAAQQGEDWSELTLERQIELYSASS